MLAKKKKKKNVKKEAHVNTVAENVNWSNHCGKQYKNSSKKLKIDLAQFSSLNCVQLFATPWTAARQASLSITNSQSLLKLISTESVMPSNHLILCCPLLLPPSIFPNIRVFSNESILHIKWPKYWSFSFNMSPSNERIEPTVQQFHF